MGIRFDDAILPAVGEIVRRCGERIGEGHCYVAANKIKIAMKAPEDRKIADRVIFQIGSKHQNAVLEPAKTADSGEGKLTLTNDNLEEVFAVVDKWITRISERYKPKNSLKSSDKREKRNPAWTHDELILALDLYFRVPPWTISGEHPEIAKLSEDLNRLAAHTDVADSVRYRNMNGTYMKLMNLRSLDPSQGGRGLKGAGQNDRDVWAEYGHRPEEVMKVATAIRAALNAPEISNATGIGEPDSDDITEAIEGAILTRLHRVRERKPKIVKAKKAQAIKRDGCLKCEACDFDFVVRYGDLGVEYIECHHRTPIAELPEHGTTKLEDLALVCSNCHRMLHRRKKWLTVEELRAIIRA